MALKTRLSIVVADKQVQLDQASEECREVVEKLRSSAGRYKSAIRIKSVTRIQNKRIYRLYAVFKQDMEEKYQDTEFEGKITKELWHGTAHDTVYQITHNGFNRSYCGKNAVAYGDGVYFATNSEYSCQSTYSPPDKNGTKYVILANVVVGEYTRGARGLREPPLRPGSDKRRFDSVVDSRNPNMHVMFYDANAYPAYVIEFQRKRT